jgi:hypothetical protein
MDNYEKYIQQNQKLMEKAFKDALTAADTIKANAEAIRQQANAELDAAREARAQAEANGEKMAADYFEDHREQLMEFSRIELLRNLVRRHLEVGESAADIIHWLGVEPQFVQNIQDVLDRLEHARLEKVNANWTIPEGKPKLRITSEGRGGTIFYDSETSHFNMWWEFAGGNALVIIDIPTEQYWTARTQLPIEQRDIVLQYIGEQVVESQTRGRGSFIIGDNVLTIY